LLCYFDGANAAVILKMGNLHEVKKRNICKLAVIASLTGVCIKLANFGLGDDYANSGALIPKYKSFSQNILLRHVLS
jgi:hypothetical protein